MEPAGIAAGLGLLKNGFDTFRSLLSLVKDVKETLPPGEKKEAIAQTLEVAERQIQIGEAQIAQALGFALCRCAFPPTPMLKVGRTTRTNPPRDVHECPRCGQDDAYPIGYNRRIPPRSIATTSS
jgi:hypothetical protein